MRIWAAQMSHLCKVEHDRASGLVKQIRNRVDLCHDQLQHLLSFKNCTYFGTNCHIWYQCRLCIEISGFQCTVTAFMTQEAALCNA